MIVFASDVDREQHIALVRGDLDPAPPPLVRVHSHCLTGDVFGSTTCDCYEMVARSLEAIAREDRGVFVYLHHTGRGFAIEQPPRRVRRNAARALSHARPARSAIAARQRLLQHESGIGAQILIDLGLTDAARAHQSSAQARGARRLRPDHRRPGAAAGQLRQEHATSASDANAEVYASADACETKTLSIRERRRWRTTTQRGIVVSGWLTWTTRLQRAPVSSARGFDERDVGSAASCAVCAG